MNVHDFVQQVDQLAADRRRFYVSPTRWQSSRVTIPLAWSRVKFDAQNRAAIPKARGIYAFVVQHDNDHFPPHGFIMYIGITGARSVERNLRLRYGDYLREKEKNKRPRVCYMLNKWESDLFFYFVPIPNRAINLDQLELDLNDSILPPIVIKDFTAEIRMLVKALEE
jgi:hypothetical protein